MDIHVRGLTRVYLVQSQQCIQFDEAMAVSEKNLGWNELDVLWVTVEMWPKFDGFGEE